ncbi:MAG: restriction endonuclease [Anaerolineae bacterium]|nr:restriction endonuclease [Anaerolineae bacterium]MCO5189780.1 restriction endonuclease [Anaerolineae bacterium]MCO5196455.1 restriction endonuclease [Anaerolineae bacterium]MCO5207266.1 restriction endonuclease [Anaerolineae bacterium]
MAIPDYQSLMLPLLQLAADGKEHSLRETYDVLGDKFHLTNVERKELLPSGRQATFNNRVGWARTYLVKAGLLKSTRRGHYSITERGQSILQQNPLRIDAAFLRQFEEFREFQKPTAKNEQVATSDIDDSQTPEETIESAYQKMRRDLAQEILETIQTCSPGFFEKLVVDLIVKMGYGGTRAEAGKAVGGSGDEGIDGIINEDRLGLDVVYIQAKRWQTTVSRPEIQKFAGALQGRRARKGIFITTSDFSQGARDFASRIDSKIVLISGDNLAELMIDYGVGVTTFVSYDMKRIDSDYFEEG